jgi:hypothetical protein
VAHLDGGRFAQPDPVVAVIAPGRLRWIGPQCVMA